MYIPKLNLMTDHNEIVAFMQQFSFAIIITTKQDLPIATHLPFIVTEENGSIVLYSHFAKANEQWNEIENQTVLVIFSEPHAYISPKHYEKELNVPTWNYLSVHAYGQAKLVVEPDEAMNLLNNTISKFDSSYQEQWEKLPETYKTGMMKGIVGFKITVTNLQAKKKLSQNKTSVEQQNIINELKQSSNSNERLIGVFMEKEKLS